MATRPRILLTRPIPDAGLRLLRRRGDVTVLPGDAEITVESLRNAVRGIDALLCFVAEPITADVLEAAAPSCRVVSSFGVGVDNIDLDAATRLGIRVTNTPDVLTDATADLAFALILAVGRRLGQATALARSGDWKGIEPMQIFGHDVSGGTLGIVGAGRIGTAVARRALGFEMGLLYADPRPNATVEAMGGRRVPLDDLLSQSDHVTLHVPLLEGTRHLIDANRVALMKRTACLINTSRGAVVNQADLIAALRNGVIAGAGLDVYENEPEIPRELLEMSNVVCLPHIGSATIETRSKMAEIAAGNLIACLDDRPARNPAD
jgi:glyoxylate reductase